MSKFEFIETALGFSVNIHSPDSRQANIMTNWKFKGICMGGYLKNHNIFSQAVQGQAWSSWVFI